MKATNQGKYALRMSGFFAGYFFPFGIYIPFFAVWLKSLDFSPEAIGLVLTIPMVTRVLFTPVMAALSDKLGNRRLALRIYCGLYGLTFALILLNDSLWWIALIMAISHIFQSAIIPVADSLALAGTRRFGLDYGRMRSSGSFSFMLANLAGGFILGWLGADKIIWLMVLGNILHILFSFSLPVDPRLIDNRTLSKQTKMDWQQLKQFAQIGFWIVLIATSLIQASHSMLYSFATIYWQKIGIPSNITGLLWSVSVLAEVLLFTFSKKISSFLNWKQLMSVAAIMACLRWTLFPFELPIFVYFILQILHAGTFACAHLGAMFFINEIVDDALSGTAQGLYTMLTGLLSAIATTVSGYLFAQWSGMAFLSMAIVSLMALSLLITARSFILAPIKAD
ncbi:MFS transporter [uncultured Cohaesibacter sp.]|uniref:MFS transporter n=1 Tax=uncultured Cohaesibacter sp. TaxID=1002546 RepID=UPI00292FA151|nr:MFS transporter [uncultured Cohaesibacter sp.]